MSIKDRTSILKFPGSMSETKKPFTCVGAGTIQLLANDLQQGTGIPGSSATIREGAIFASATASSIGTGICSPP